MLPTHRVRLSNLVPGGYRLRPAGSRGRRRRPGRGGGSGRTRRPSRPAGPLGKGARGLTSLVKTAPGPRNTSSSTVTPDNSSTPFLMVTESPTTTPPSTKLWPPTLQSAPILAPASTWANAQMRVRGPTSSLSQSALGCTNTEGSRAIPERYSMASLRPPPSRGPGEPVRTAVAAASTATPCSGCGVVAAGVDPVQVEAMGAVGDAQGPDAGVEGPAALAGRHPAGVELAGAFVAPGVAGDPGRTRTVAVHGHRAPPRRSGLRPSWAGTRPSGRLGRASEGSSALTSFNRRSGSVWPAAPPARPRRTRGSPRPPGPGPRR